MTGIREGDKREQMERGRERETVTGGLGEAEESAKLDQPVLLEG